MRAFTEKLTYQQTLTIYNTINRLMDIIEIQNPDFYSKSGVVTEADKILKFFDGEITKDEAIEFALN